MKTTVARRAEFTGRHMLFMMLAFFGVIIAANATMATFASSSWTGLVVQNSYVASQQFNRKAQEGRAQAALGWKSRMTIDGGEIRFALADAGGKPIVPKAVSAQFRHPAYAAEDKTLTLTLANGREFAAALGVRDGLWIVQIDADAGLERPYREIRRIVIANGAMR
jgi:nitrogen fixation protein FixH